MIYKLITLHKSPDKWFFSIQIQNDTWGKELGYEDNIFKSRYLVGRSCKILRYIVIITKFAVEHGINYSTGQVAEHGITIRQIKLKTG